MLVCGITDANAGLIGLAPWGCGSRQVIVYSTRQAASERMAALTHQAQI
jgi:hypothetical protein